MFSQKQSLTPELEAKRCIERFMRSVPLPSPLRLRTEPATAKSYFAAGVRPEIKAMRTNSDRLPAFILVMTLAR